MPRVAPGHRFPLNDCWFAPTPVPSPNAWKMGTWEPPNFHGNLPVREPPPLRELRPSQGIIKGWWSLIAHDKLWNRSIVTLFFASGNLICPIKDPRNRKRGWPWNKTCVLLSTLSVQSGSLKLEFYNQFVYMVESDKVHWLTRKPPQKMCNGHMVVYFCLQIVLQNDCGPSIVAAMCFFHVFSTICVYQRVKQQVQIAVIVSCCDTSFYPAAFFDVKVPHWRTEIADFRGVFAYEWVRLVVHPCWQCMFVMGSRFFGNVQRFWIQRHCYMDPTFEDFVMLHPRIQCYRMRWLRRNLSWKTRHNVVSRLCGFCSLFIDLTGTTVNLRIWPTAQICKYGQGFHWWLLMYHIPVMTSLSITCWIMLIGGTPKQIAFGIGSWCGSYLTPECVVPQLICCAEAKTQTFSQVLNFSFCDPCFS